MSTYLFTAACTACGACLLTCPTAAIAPTVPLVLRADRCTDCGECVEVCPADAIERRFGVDHGVPPGPLSVADAGQLHDRRAWAVA